MYYLQEMKQINNNGHIYKPLMAGLFAGYFAALICVVFDVLFRGYTGFPLHELINVSTLIFSILLILPIAGCIYALIDVLFKRSSVVYLIVAVVVLALLSFGIFHLHRSADPLINHQFHFLLFGITMISGVGVLSVPYFVKHSEIFM